MNLDIKFIKPESTKTNVCENFENKACLIKWEFSYSFILYIYSKPNLTTQQHNKHTCKTNSK